MDAAIIESIVNFGALTVVLGLLLTGQLTVRREVEELRRDRDRYRDLSEKLVESTQGLPEIQDTILHSVNMILRLLEDVTGQEAKRV